ncbi:MAG TPA: hypothetical protein VMB26_10965, partial [Candidatus Binataceae bacterium]|nr:hypothetical protein [Candidatus Binataceae bacterium]
WGRVLANLGTAEFAATTVALDPALLENARSSLPVLRGVRPQAYATAPHVLTLPAAGKAHIQPTQGGAIS